MPIAIRKFSNDFRLRNTIRKSNILFECASHRIRTTGSTRVPSTFYGAKHCIAVACEFFFPSFFFFLFVTRHTHLELVFCCAVISITKSRRTVCQQWIPFLIHRFTFPLLLIETRGPSFLVLQNVSLYNTVSVPISAIV